MSAPRRFTMQEARDIRRRVASGEKQMAIAAEFGVSGATISNIVHKRIYKDEESLDLLGWLLARAAAAQDTASRRNYHECIRILTEKMREDQAP